ncbi:hypothetical protein D3C87_2188650 [compost metagenome]
MSPPLSNAGRDEAKRRRWPVRDRYSGFTPRRSRAMNRRLASRSQMAKANMPLSFGSKASPQA